MPHFIVSYDLISTAANAHTTFKRRAAERQWSDRITINNGSLAALPNTTLCGEFATLQDAEGAFFAALTDTQRELRQIVSIPRNVIVLHAASSAGSDEVQPPMRGLGAFFGR